MEFKMDNPVKKRVRIEVGDIFQMKQAFFMVMEKLEKSPVGDYNTKRGFVYVNLSQKCTTIPFFNTLNDLNDDVYSRAAFIEVFDHKKIEINLEGAKK